MTKKPTYEDLELRIRNLEKESAIRGMAEEALRESEDQANRMAQESSIMAEIGSIINASLNLEEVYERFTAEVSKLIPFDRSSISLVNLKDSTVSIDYVTGIGIAERTKGRILPLANSIGGHVVSTRKSLLIPSGRTYEFAEKFPTFLPSVQAGIRSLMAVPLISKDEVIGILYFRSALSDLYSEKTLRLAERVGNQITSAIANSVLFAEHRRTEEALRVSEQRFRDLFDNAPVGYHEYDLEGRITKVNRTELDMLGYSERDLLGQFVWKLSVEEENAHREVQAKLAGALLPALDFERTYRRKDGTAFPVLISNRIVQDAQGNMQGIRSSVYDIAERKRAEAALQESERRFRLLVENAPEAIFVRVKDRFVYVNKAAVALFGASSADQLVGELILDRVHPNCRATVAERMISIDETRENLPLSEQTCLRLDGSLVSIETSEIPFNFDGQDGTLVFTRDITARKKAEEEREKLQSQLVQAQKMESVGRLAGGVAHDFNNQLGVIIGYAEMAMRKVAPVEPPYRQLDEILKAGRRSANLVNQLLAFARKQAVSPKVLDLNATVSGMLNMLRRLIGEDIDLTWTPCLDIWPVRIDPSQIDQILANLAVNARDAITGVGKVAIRTGNVLLDEAFCNGHAGAASGQYVLLSVTDNGAGISSETLGHIFEPFFTTKEVGRGTGLGLATVYGIVKQNEGYIEVISEPGEGTTFKIYLPRCEGASVKVREGEEDEKLLPGGAETILIVEDEASFLNLVENLLTAMGYTVLTSEIPTDAFALLEKHGNRIDLLLTDVVMPEMNGRHLAEKMKLTHPDLKCLFMSGYTADVLAHHGVLDEGVRFIQKPFSPRALAERVRELLDCRKS